MLAKGFFKQKIKIFLCIAVFSSISLATSAQEGIFFKHLRTNNGLSHNKVNCILQDKRGFIWIGTEDGLNRYDGRYFSTLQSEPENKASISGNIINDLYEDQDGVLWVATEDGGISKYDYRLPTDEMFKQFKQDLATPKGIPENNIKKIVEDRFGNLWLASSKNYVVRFNKKTEQFDIPIKIGTKGILTLALDQQDTLWVGREGGGLLKIDTKTLTYQDDERYYQLYEDLPQASISAIFKDRQGNIWGGSWDKDLILLKKNTPGLRAMNTKSPLPSPKDVILSFADDADHRIWMATEQSGAILYNVNDNSFTNFKNNPYDDGSLIDNHVNAVYVDRAGTVWIGTNNGLSVYNPLFYPFKKHFVDRPSKDLKIYDFFKDPKKRLWIGTSEGLYVKHPGKSSYEHRKLVFKGQKLSVTKFFLDEDGTFYLGTDYTLFTYDPEKNQLHSLPNTEKDPVMGKLISSRIVSIVKDTINKHPVLIVSPYGHYFSYYDLKDQQWISRTNDSKKIIQTLEIKDHLIPKFYKDSSGLWMATSSYGLAFWDPQKRSPITYYSNEPSKDQSLNSNYVYDILSDAQNNLWISTYGGGLSKYDKKTKKFSHISCSSNLSEGMQLDERGNVWMISNGHVHKYEEISGVYSCYDIPSLRKTGGVKGYIYKDDEGNLYAAGNNYYIVFNPANIQKVDYSPAVYFTDFKIFQKSYPHLLEDSVIHLNYTQNYFSINFSAPDFNGDNIQYAYKLEGFDKEWVDAGKYNVANYSNLHGGAYHFLLQARNWKGEFNGPYKSLYITISPPFWNRWWFYAIIFVFLCGIAYSIHRYRLKARWKDALIRNGIARDLHDQVGSTLSSIAIYAEVAKIYQEQKQTDRLQEILLDIRDSANDMVNEMGDIVWALNTKNDHFASLADRVRSFSQPLCKAKDIKFLITCGPSLLYVSLGMKERKNLFLILKEAINNAIKYANCQHIKVTINNVHSFVRVEISDDGVGFKPDHPDDKNKSVMKGNGLPNLKHRAKELAGDLVINSKPGKGTTIVLTFPLLN